MEATLEDLFVVPTTRNHGVATQLMEFAPQRAKEKGCRLVKLNTNESNADAVRLYRKLGFTPNSIRYSNSRQIAFEKELPV